MNRIEKVQRRANLGKDISEVVIELLSPYKIAKKTLTQIIYPSLGLTESSARSFVDSVEKGYANQYLPLEDAVHPGLERLEIFFYMIRLPKNHQIVSKIQNNYSNFVYPPKNPSDLPILAKLDENYL